MNSLFGNAVFLVLAGNYGSGKTEIALNLAFASAPRHWDGIILPLRREGNRQA